MNTNTTSITVIEIEVTKGTKVILEEIYYMTITLICMENSAMVIPINKIFQKLMSKTF
jgi:hypothetical protein